MLSKTENFDLKDQVDQISKRLVKVPLSPDEIDEFIDWIIERWDLQSFYRSSIQFKSNELKKFLKEKEDDNG